MDRGKLEVCARAGCDAVGRDVSTVCRRCQELETGGEGIVDAMRIDPVEVIQAVEDVDWEGEGLGVIT